jgi:hypothetical protein
LKLARLLILQPLLMMLAIGTFFLTSPKAQPPTQSQISPIDLHLAYPDQSLPAAGLFNIKNSGYTEVVPTAAPVIPTSMPEEDARVISLPVAAPALEDFLQRVPAGDPEHVVGVYAPDVLDLLVEQQPPNHSLYVTTKLGYATQFLRPLKYDVIGLLAHNTHSGILFYGLEPGHEVYLVYGDGQVILYEVEAIADYQKLEPHNSRSDYVDLATGKVMSTNEVFYRFYKNGHHLILQTCLKFEGDFNWGVRFIQARPVGLVDVAGSG